MQHYVLTDQDDCTGSVGSKTEAVWRPKARHLRDRRNRLLAKRLRSHKEYNY